MMTTTVARNIQKKNPFKWKFHIKFILLKLHNIHAYIIQKVYTTLFVWYNYDIQFTNTVGVNIIVLGNGDGRRSVWWVRTAHCFTNTLTVFIMSQVYIKQKRKCPHTVIYKSKHKGMCQQNQENVIKCFFFFFALYWYARVKLSQ